MRKTSNFIVISKKYMVRPESTIKSSALKENDAYKPITQDK